MGTAAQGNENGAEAIRSPSVLSVQRVDKRYPNGTVALEDVRFSIEAGEFVSLLGPSGCGKSTLLKMFAGIEAPTHGHLRWWGQSFDTVGSEGRRQSMVHAVFASFWLPISQERCASHHL